MIFISLLVKSNPSSSKTLTLRVGVTSLSMLLFLSACSHMRGSQEDSITANQTNTASVEVQRIEIEDSLVSVAWLHDHLHEPDLVILDATVLVDFDENGKINIASGRSAYMKEHIPGAGFADLTNEMPPLASQVVDIEAVNIVEQWINSLPNCN